MTVNDGAGIYYNLETYRNAYMGRFSNIYRLEKVISKSQLESASNYILNHNVWDLFIVNCCWFAAGVWNAGGGAYIFPVVVFPSIMRAQMMAHGASRSVSMFSPRRDQVLRQNGSGSGAYTSVASDASLS